MNPLKGEVPLALPDGRSLKLVLDFEAMVQAESVYGKPMVMLILDAKQGFQGADRAMLWGALRTYHPEIDLRAASEILRQHRGLVVTAMDASAAAAYPEHAEGKEGANPPSGRARAGTSSGASGAKPGSTRTRSGGRRPKLSS